MVFSPDQIICFVLLDYNGQGISLLGLCVWTITLEEHLYSYNYAEPEKQDYF